MFRVFSGDDRETILVRNRGEPKENRLQSVKGRGQTQRERRARGRGVGET